MSQIVEEVLAAYAEYTAGFAVSTRLVAVAEKLPENSLKLKPETLNANS